MKINMMHGVGGNKKKRKNPDESDEDSADDREYLNNQMFKYKHK